MENSCEVDEDIGGTYALLEGEKVLSNYDFIYTHSNECLSELFEYFDVKDKRVLTVLSSSDQLFNCLIRDCFSVDTYDINKLTKYFYYLRKWNIMYNGEFYLPSSITGTFIYNLLNKVSVSTDSEEEAYKYWSKFIRKFPGFLYKYFFYTGVRDNYSFDFSLDDLKDKLSSYDLFFKCLDMGSSVDISSKYDVVITSNLSEYFVNDLEKISNYKNNLDNILDSNGYIISSHMLNSYIPYSEESLFNSLFNSKEFPFHYDKFFNNYLPLGYCYQKKKDGVNKK